MLFKTSVGYHRGCLQGPLGPASCQLPEVGCYIDEFDCGWKLFRVSEGTMVLADYSCARKPQGRWQRFLKHAHGVLLRRIGKIRVVYLMRVSSIEDIEYSSLWHSNVNLVTGVTKKWLDEDFNMQSLGQTCIVAG